MKYNSLLVPIGLIVGLILVFFVAFMLNQPVINQLPEENYVNVNGDEYLDEEYISPYEEGIGEFDQSLLNEEYAPLLLEDCELETEEDKEYCYSYYSIMTGDPEGCEETTEIGLRDDCFAQVALTNKDASLCDRIKAGYSECYVSIGIDTNNAAYCEKGNFEQEQCFKAAKSGKYTDCAEGYQRKICNDAVTAKDESVCEEMVDFRGYCYSAVAINTSNQTLCNKLPTNERKDSCFFRISLNKNNHALCENILSVELRDNCVAWVAFNTNNKQLCYQAGKEAQSCLDDLA